MDVYLPVEAVRDAAAGRLVVPTALELVSQAGPAVVDVAPATIEAAIHDIVERVDVDGYLEALVCSHVAVPTTVPVADADRILQPGFPWRVTNRGGVETIEVFTCAETLAAIAPAGMSHVTVEFPVVLVVVKSARGAVQVFRPDRFLGPLPEPDVPVSPASGSPQASWGLRGVRPHPVVGQGLGMIVPR